MTISGNVGIGNATLSFEDNGPKTITAASNGAYSLTVSYNWSGTVTPSKMGYAFTPFNHTYIDITVGQTSQNYTATPTTTYRIYLPLVIR